MAQISETLPVLAACQPTFAHMLLARLVSLGAVAFVVSQNCDGLHLRSGLDAQRLAELHGNCFIEFCPSCEHVRVMPCVVPNIVPCIVQLGGESKVQTCLRFNAWRTSTFKLALGEGDCADCWWLLCTVLYLCVSVSVCVFLSLSLSIFRCMSLSLSLSPSSPPFPFLSLSLCSCTAGAST